MEVGRRGRMIADPPESFCSLQVKLTMLGMDTRDLGVLGRISLTVISD
jgi:hypothetical protein